jgi:hypothetical protein
MSKVDLVYEDLLVALDCAVRSTDGYIIYFCNAFTLGLYHLVRLRTKHHVESILRVSDSACALKEAIMPPH